VREIDLNHKQRFMIIL